MPNPLVSVIIPIYNVELYLKECLDSVIYQSYQNLEILLINDGSTDKSGDIAKEYASQDKRIRYFEQENQGQSVARNKGLDYANGEYIYFLDSDDWIDLGYIEELVGESLKGDSDLVCNIHFIPFIAPAPSTTYITQSNQYTSKLIYITRQNLNTIYQEVIGVVWNRLFKKSMIDSLYLRFLDGKMCEDELFTLSVITMIKSIKIIYGLPYHYRQHQRPDSLTSKTRINHIRPIDIVDLFESSIKWYENHNLLQRYDLPFFLIRGRDDTDCFANPYFNNANIFFKKAKEVLSKYPQDLFQSDPLTYFIITSPNLFTYRLRKGFHQGFKQAFKTLFRIRISKNLKVIILFGFVILYKDER